MLDLHASHVLADKKEKFNRTQSTKDKKVAKFPPYHVLAYKEADIHVIKAYLQKLVTDHCKEEEIELTSFDFDSQDNDGNTPLLYLLYQAKTYSYSDLYERIGFLVAHGTDLNIQNNERYSSYDVINSLVQHRRIDRIKVDNVIKTAKQNLEKETKEELKKYIENDIEEVCISGTSAKIKLGPNDKVFKMSEFLQSNFCQTNSILQFSIPCDDKEVIYGYISFDVRHYFVKSGSCTMTVVWYVNGQKYISIICATAYVVKIIGGTTDEALLDQNRNMKINGLFLLEAVKAGQSQQSSLQKAEPIKEPVREPVKEDEGTKVDKSSKINMAEGSTELASSICEISDLQRYDQLIDTHKTMPYNLQSMPAAESVNNQQQDKSQHAGSGIEEKVENQNHCDKVDGSSDLESDIENPDMLSLVIPDHNSERLLESGYASYVSPYSSESEGTDYNNNEITKQIGSEKLQKRCQDLEKQLQEERAKMAGREIQLTNVKNQLADMEKDLQSIKHIISDDKIEKGLNLDDEMFIEKTGEVVKPILDLWAKLLGKIIDLSNRYNDIKDRNNHLHQKILELEASQKELIRDNKILQEDKKRLQEDKGKIKEICDFLKEKHDKEIESNKDLLDKVEELQKENQTLKSLYLELFDQDIETLLKKQEEIDKLKMKMKKLENCSEEHKEFLKEPDKHEMTRWCDEKILKLQEKMTKLKKLEEEVTFYREQYEEANEEYRILKQKYSTLCKNYGWVKDELKEKNATIGKLCERTKMHNRSHTPKTVLTSIQELDTPSIANGREKYGKKNSLL